MHHLQEGWQFLVHLSTSAASSLPPVYLFTVQPSQKLPEVPEYASLSHSSKSVQGLLLPEIYFTSSLFG